ncbi:hypothetical protein [Paenibacillus paridis]|uniref:hypothetical protein n=1 Tax=Paenibacillus paridis TaxID=2583376 RepID=UPI00111DFD7F|nr:hypothetical protein [Paenibacillus paridis]
MAAEDGDLIGGRGEENFPASLFLIILKSNERSSTLICKVERLEGYKYGELGVHHQREWVVLHKAS